MSKKLSSFGSAVGDVYVDNLTFLPTTILLWVGNSSATSNTSIAKGKGRCTSTNQSYDSSYLDVVNNRQNQQNGTDKCIRVKKWDAATSTYVDAVCATWVDFHDNGGGNYGFKLNFTAADGRQIRFLALDI